MKLINFLNQRRKLIAFIFGTIVNAVMTALLAYYKTDAQVTMYLNIAVLVLTGLGIHLATNQQVTEIE